MPIYKGVELEIIFIVILELCVGIVVTVMNHNLEKV